MRRALTALAAAVALAVPWAITTPSYAAGSSTDPAATAQTYLVLLQGAPSATYDGGLEGLATTAPAPGKRYDADRPAVRAYTSHLHHQQAQVLDALDNPTKIYSYTTALNGFAAELTHAQVKRLQSMPGVRSVQASSKAHLDAATGTVPPQVGPVHRGVAQADASGRHGMADRHRHTTVIGVIGSGIWPENPSFAGIPIGAAARERQLPGFTGTCQPGDRWTAETCDSKVVAGRYFAKAFGRDNIARADYVSPRDANGHGSRTAAIAAGHSGVDVRIEDQDFGHISGTAPHARLAIYKACWSAPDPDDDGCTTADTVKAIDQAVADGVDVINYSISGATSSYTTAVDVAFRGAAASGVFVATSAGNGGPSPASVRHPSPWVTTVGANTRDVYQGAVRLGNGSSFVGAMLSETSVGPTRLVYAGDAAAPSSDRSHAALCYPGSLDAGQVDDAIVVCDRGVVARVTKSTAVDRAGGAGMVLVNRSRGSVDADQHQVPTVHLAAGPGRSVKTYIDHAGTKASATLRADGTDHPKVPQIAGFSGRGPSVAAEGDILKPDVTAPGVSVVAASSPRDPAGHLWDVSSGTSMAAPYVAGLAARITSTHPRWTPSMIKSALMTTATPLEGRSGALVQGAGQVSPKHALNPGLVYGSEPADWMRFLRGQGITYADGRAVASSGTDASDLNLPSISIGSLVGHQVITRTVTNVGDHAEKYIGSMHGLHGIGASITPGRFTLRPGESQTFRVALDATKRASYARFATGTLTWNGSRGHVVRSPVAVRPQLVSAPTEVAGSGRDGSFLVTAIAGVTGTLRTTTVGLSAASSVRLDLRAGAFDRSQPDTNTSTAMREFDVPPGTAVTRFSVSAHGPRDDVDLYVYRSNTLVDAETSHAGDELVTLTTPKPGRYRVYVNCHKRSSGGAGSFELTGWVVPRGNAGNLDVTPQPVKVTGGQPLRLRVSWAGLDTSKRWFGYVAYRHSSLRTYVTLN